MKTRTALLALAAAGAAVATTLALAAGPERGHPNIIAARQDTQRAIDRMKTAQRANEFDMGGHAQHAIDLLSQAQEEMRLAAEATDEHRR